MSQTSNLFTPPSTGDDPEDQTSSDLEVGEHTFPLEDPINVQEVEETVDIGKWEPELDLCLDAQDAEGPNQDIIIDPIWTEQPEAGDGDAGDGPLSTEMSLPNDALPPSDPNDDFCLEDNVVGTDSCGDFSDTAFNWSSQPWCERRMTRAFVPRVGLVGRDNFVLATGDSTDLLAANTLESLVEAPFLGRTCSAAFLDSEAERVLIATATGQILIWDRNKCAVETPLTEGLGTLDCVTCICEGTPGSGEVWALLAHGSLHYRVPESQSFRPFQSLESYLWIVPNDLGVCALTRDLHLVNLSTRIRPSTNRIRIPHNANSAAFAKNPIVALSKTYVLVGAREFGAWLSIDAGRTFQEIAGCHGLTACTFGTYAGRACLWLALFFELDDRTELITVDCKSRRASRVVNFSVVADCAGPDDDPPERARIDSLYWDSVHQRLWAAGGFGLTCFEPPQSTQPSC
jgi:hypothetical protein